MLQRFPDDRQGVVKRPAAHVPVLALQGVAVGPVSVDAAQVAFALPPQLPEALLAGGGRFRADPVVGGPQLVRLVPCPGEQALDLEAEHPPGGVVLRFIVRVLG